MKIEVKHTPRGFAVAEFKDHYGVKCSVQKSSLATENAIWIGCDEADPRVLVQGQGWKPYAVPEDVLLNTRMHLTQAEVAKLLPVLQRFVDTGEVT